MNSPLSNENFLSVVTQAPLVAVDLLVRNEHGSLLLGLRSNEPARGYWFVPGGRVRKEETLDDAFYRISRSELNVALARSSGTLIGVYTHVYPTNFLGVPDVSTHYVVLAYEVQMDLPLSALPNVQHTQYGWWSSRDAEASPKVHENVLPYFRDSRRAQFPSLPETWLAQYEHLNNRRNSFTQLLWQTPAISLTAQAFLFSIAFAKDTEPRDVILVMALALASSLGSLFLLVKHRMGEEETAKLAQVMEERAGIDTVNARNPTGRFDRDAWYRSQSAYRLWFGFLSIFAAASLAVAIRASFQVASGA